MTAQLENTTLRELTADELFMVSGGDRMERCAMRYLWPAERYDRNATFAQNVMYLAIAIQDYMNCVKGAPINN